MTLSHTLSNCLSIIFFPNFIAWIFSKTAISLYSSKVITHVGGSTEGLSTEIVSRDGSCEVLHFKIQRRSTIVLSNKNLNVCCWYSLRNISVIKLCFLIPVHVMVTKFKLPTVVYALRWDHHGSGVRDHHVVSHDRKVHAFNKSTFQLYKQLSKRLVFRKKKKLDLHISHLNFWLYRLTKISTAFLISVPLNDSKVGLYNHTAGELS